MVKHEEDVMPSAMEVASTALTRIDIHEKVCSERYQQILDNQKSSAAEREILHLRISEVRKSITIVLLSIAGSTILLLLSIVGALIWRFVIDPR